MNFKELNDLFRNKNKSPEITEANILAAGYSPETSNRKLYLLFNIWCEQFNFRPSFKENEPNIDHIFPQSALKKVKVKGDKGRSVQKYKVPEINQIGNCMLLTLNENQGAGKSDILPKDWFATKSKEYLEMHLIPQDKNLWEIDNYEEFIKERNKLIVNKVN
ncbi:DUF1524 domain-containing protein [Clostridium gasigenes]|uniref:GmrSD restriction endonuclease domain-containing protein n=1 Tax=Clostridium gasigenes TaxID=94869 RepID=UPI0016267F78|nr:DUF1524 domain-containing protein [Clostridium gasigenes]MBB6623372.1 DUF1524 domain-containing protein [Clostridium gasigenes]